MSDGEEADVDHRLAETGLDNTVAHADDEKEEKGKRVSACIEDSDNDHEKFGQSVGVVTVLIVCGTLAAEKEIQLGGQTIKAPGHELLNDQKDDDRRDVVLYRYC